MPKNLYFWVVFEFCGFWGSFGAGDEIRTHDIHLGKVTLYP